MGKTQKYTITDPKSPATNRQTYTLYFLTGVDVRNTKITKGDAAMCIDKINQGKAYHVRQGMIDIGGVVKKRDVEKSHRQDPKPRKKAAPKAKPKSTRAKPKKAVKKDYPTLDDADRDILEQAARIAAKYKIA